MDEWDELRRLLEEDVRQNGSRAFATGYLLKLMREIDFKLSNDVREEKGSEESNSSVTKLQRANYELRDIVYSLTDMKDPVKCEVCGLIRDRARTSDCLFCALNADEEGHA